MGRAGIRAGLRHRPRQGHRPRAATEFEEHGQEPRPHHRHRAALSGQQARCSSRTSRSRCKDKRLDGISDLRDESDRNGMRIVIELKRDANPQVVLNQPLRPDPAAEHLLHQHAGARGQPAPAEDPLPAPHSRRVSQVPGGGHHAPHASTTCDKAQASARTSARRTAHRRRTTSTRSSTSSATSYDDAKENLMARFGLDDVQAQAILDMRLKAPAGTGPREAAE